MADSLVESIDDIHENIETLLRYLDPENRALDSDNRAKRDFARALIRDGAKFVVVQSDGDFVFAPSKFIGYQYNNFEDHARARGQTRDGRTTTRRIIEILKTKPSDDAAAEDAYKEFCYRMDIRVRPTGLFRNRREYWLVGNARSIRDSLTADLDALRSDGNLSETERQAQILARIGQGKFRDELIEYWNGCAVTGCEQLNVLRASHIRRWASCETRQQRLDMWNGLLLVPNLDAAFEVGLISFGQNGEILISPGLSKKDSKTLGINSGMKIDVKEGHQPYLQFHRKFHGLESSKGRRR